MVTKKDKRHSGRYTPKLHSKIPFNKMKEEALEPLEEYDEWSGKDGFRDVDGLERKKKDKGKFPYKLGGRRRCN